jgi:hypothetical protein
MTTSTEPRIHKVSVLGKDSIHCGFHLTPYIAKTVVETLPSSTYVLITDTRVASFHLAAFETAFKEALSAQSQQPKSRFLTHLIPPGETTKSREGKAEIEDFLLGNACTRDTVILACGGGVVGDLVGFVAATLYAATSRLSAWTLITLCVRATDEVCAVSALCKSLPHFWQWLTRALEGRQPSTPLTERTS